MDLVARPERYAGAANPSAAARQPDAADAADTTADQAIGRMILLTEQIATAAGTGDAALAGRSVAGSLNARDWWLVREVLLQATLDPELAARRFFAMLFGLDHDPEEEPAADWGRVTGLLDATVGALNEVAECFAVSAGHASSGHGAESPDPGPVVAEALMGAIEQTPGNDFTPTEVQAWRDVFAFLFVPRS